MTMLALAQVIALVSGICNEGTVTPCGLSGCQVASRECAMGRLGPCTCQDPIDVAIIRSGGRYNILGVWYAIPGPGSSTTYSNRSESGTTMSTTTGSGGSFQVSASESGSFFGLAGAGYELTYSNAWSQSSTTKRDAIVSYMTDHIINGPGFDTVDHNYDQIVLLLGPDIVFTTESSYGVLKKVRWAVDSSRAIVFPVQVGWLNGAWGSMPANIATTLASYGIAAVDFPNLLAANPYAHDSAGNGPVALDRYECIEQLYYVPGLPNIENYQVANTYSSSNTTTVSSDYSVKLTLTGTILSSKFNGSDTWTWRNSSSTANSVTQGGSQKITLRQPTAAYVGPTVVYVYVDMIYKTLLYSFEPPVVPNANCQ